MALNGYPAVFYRWDDGYWVEFPDLPGCNSQGDTLREAYMHAKEAISEFLVDHQPEKPSEMSIILKAFPNEKVMLIPFGPILAE